MRFTKPDMDIEKQLLIGLITSDNFVKKILPVFNYGYLDLETVKKLAKGVLDYYEVYGKAPGQHIQDIFNVMKKSLSEEEADWIERVLVELDSRAEKSGGFNEEYLFGNCVAYFNKQKLRKGAEKVLDLLEADKQDQAFKVASELQTGSFSGKETQSEGHSLRSIMEMRISRPKWLVQGIVPQGLTILVSKPKVGKSYLAMNIAFALAEAGLAFCSVPVEKASVLYLALEDPVSRIQDRTKEINPNEVVWDRITIFEQGTWPMMHEGGIQKLRSWLDGNKETGLVVIDTLERIRRRHSANPYGYGESYQIISQIRELAWEYKIAIWANHHQRKGKTEDIFDTILGSTGDYAACDTGMVLTEEKRGRADAILHIRGKDVENLELALNRNQHNWKLLGRASDFRRSKERQNIVDFLKEQNRPVKRDEIFKLREDPQGKAGTGTILKRMVDEGDIEKQGYGLYAINGYKPSVQDELGDKIAEIRGKR